MGDWGLCCWSLPNLPWLSQSLRVPLAHRGQFPAAPTTCWECTLCHLPNGRIDTAFENRRPWKEVMTKFSASQILHKQNNILWSYSCKMPFGMLLFQPWCPVPTLELSRVRAGLSRCCWMNSSVWSWEEMSHCGAFCIRNERLSLGSEYSGTVAVFLGEFICAVSSFCISSKPKVGQTVPVQFLLVLLGMSGPWAVGKQSWWLLGEQG